MENKYSVRAYPKSGWRHAPGLQAQLTSRAQRVDRHLLKLFLGFGFVFLVALAVAAAGLGSGLLFGVITLSGALPLAALIFIPPPRTSCPECSVTMEREMTAKGEFLVCRQCRIHAFTHRRAPRP